MRQGRDFELFGNSRGVKYDPAIFTESNVFVGPESRRKRPDDLIRIFQVDVVAYYNIYSPFGRRFMGDNRLRIPRYQLYKVCRYDFAIREPGVFR